jgi:hypothetical protein
MMLTVVITLGSPSTEQRGHASLSGHRMRTCSGVVMGKGRGQVPVSIGLGEQCIGLIPIPSLAEPRDVPGV